MLTYLKPVTHDCSHNSVDAVTLVEGSSLVSACNWLQLSSKHCPLSEVDDEVAWWKLNYSHFLATALHFESMKGSAGSISHVAMSLSILASELAGFIGYFQQCLMCSFCLFGTVYFEVTA